MKAGDTFFLRGEQPIEHLWIVASLPEADRERIVIVHITTYEYHKDDACMLYAGDHERIHHDTFIAYNAARLISLDTLEARERDGTIRRQSPVSDEILQRIREALARQNGFRSNVMRFSRLRD